MKVTALKAAVPEQEKTNWVAVARELGKAFGEQAAAVDGEDRFVAENYAALKANGLVAAGSRKSWAVAARATPRCARSCASWRAIAARRRLPSRCTRIR